MTAKTIPPKNEWSDLTVMQLYEVKSDLMDVYFGMRGANATFANQYQKFIADVDALILRKSAEQQTEQD